MNRTKVQLTIDPIVWVQTRKFFKNQGQSISWYVQKILEEKLEKEGIKVEKSQDEPNNLKIRRGR